MADRDRYGGPFGTGTDMPAIAERGCCARKFKNAEEENFLHARLGSNSSPAADGAKSIEMSVCHVRPQGQE